MSSKERHSNIYVAKLRLLGIATLLLSLVFFMGLIAGRINRTPKAPDLTNPQVWLPIKVFRGTLDSESGEVEVTVSAIFRLSDDQNTNTVMQNKIEIRSTKGSFQFQWPDSGSFVAGWCDILDVDDDGNKEFLMYAGRGSLRIVSFARGEFRFRPPFDTLLSFENGVGPFDLAGDGSLEFVEDEHFPSNLDKNTKWIWIPRVKRWSRAEGFIDISKDHSQYYEQRVIPDLERRLTTEQDPDLRQIISNAVDFLKREQHHPPAVHLKRTG